jgi:poly-gamma-glutamate capsule biosynthesis protein CapA/YwtB (metallophosphatase superfamily)
MPMKLMARKNSRWAAGVGTSLQAEFGRQRPRSTAARRHPAVLIVFALLAIAAPIRPLHAAVPSDSPECQPAFADPLPAGQLMEVTLCFTGDNLLGARMPRLIEQHGADWPYSAVSEALNAADLTFGNLECPITDYAVRTPGKSWESIQAGHNFIFKAPPETSSSILRKAGYDVLSLANNHIMDYCAAGLLDTLSELEQAEIVAVGAGVDREHAFSARILRCNGLRIGFIARSVIVPAASKAGDAAAGLAWQAGKYDLELAAAIRELSAVTDAVVVSFHWGIEGQRRHSAYQQQIARNCIDDGALLVIGHHPHCLQGIELYNGGVIAYSLGNFLFTGKSALIESGILRITLGRGAVREVEFMPCWVRGGRPEPAPDDARLKQLLAEIFKPCGVSFAGEEGGWVKLEPAIAATQ